MLLEGLAHKANRNHRLALRFTVTDIEPDPGVPHWDPTSLLHPVPGMIFGTVDLSFDQFLARTVLVVEGTPITVKELIGFFANVEGGVHVSDAPAGNDALLRLWRPATSVVMSAKGERTSMAHVLAGISHVVVDALVPLRQAIWSALPAESRFRFGHV